MPPVALTDDAKSSRRDALVRGGRTVLALLAVVLLAACAKTQNAPTADSLTAATVSVSPASAKVAVGGATQSFTATITGATNVGVTWAVNNIPGGNATIGTISASGLYISPAAMPSAATVTISATSADDASESGAASLTLMDSGPQVTVSISPATATVRAGSGTQAFDATVTNSADTSVSWAVNGVDGGNSTVGTISAAGLYTAPATPPAQSTVTVTATSIASPSSSADASVTVTNSAAAPPTIAGVPGVTAVVGSAYAFTPTATSPTGATLTFSITNKPAWAAFSSATGKLSGTPAAADTGSYPGIVITVKDTSGSDSLPPFTITVSVTPPPAPPTISGTPTGSVQAGKAYAFTPSASSPRGAALTFSIAGKPSWASFSSSTGRLSGTPLAVNIGSYEGIVISVSDGTASASLAAFGITVTALPPTIGGTPLTSVKVGAGYSFTPTASTPSGGTLTFSIANKPSWAAFSTANGRLSGTPAAANVGTYANVVISVSDGLLSASLPPFTITVSAATTQSATLDWTPPATRTDGSALTNLAGFKVYYGTAAGVYPNVVTLANAGLVTDVVTSLGTGTWYFVVTAYDGTGAESGYSNMVATTIP